MFDLIYMSAQAESKKSDSFHDFFRLIGPLTVRVVVRRPEGFLKKLFYPYKVTVRICAEIWFDVSADDWRLFISRIKQEVQ